ncbi:hypothetical protein Vi05172_g2494 [Venturia inaequalis]|nr:hypothetical protein Vi05172_g2494 [Venturia inaequalis]
MAGRATMVPTISSGLDLPDAHEGRAGDMVTALLLSAGLWIHQGWAS